jgi:hypothetical protein
MILVLLVLFIVTELPLSVMISMISPHRILLFRRNQKSCRMPSSSTTIVPGYSESEDITAKASNAPVVTLHGWLDPFAMYVTAMKPNRKNTKSKQRVWWGQNRPCHWRLIWRAADSYMYSQQLMPGKHRTVVHHPSEQPSRSWIHSIKRRLYCL